jgi:RNA-directed DNA polymerase
VLTDLLRRVIRDDDMMWLVETIIASGAGVLEDQLDIVWFPGDDLWAAHRPRGLPIGNLTSQFWSSCYLDPLDHFIERELRCPAYLRYVDDFALFSDSKRQLWDWKRAIVDRLDALRLSIHEGAAQVAPVEAGIPWLGFIIFPTHRRVKARNAIKFTRRLRDRLDDYRAGRISFADLDASVQGWINHVSYADTWGLRRHVLDVPIPSHPTAPQDSTTGFHRAQQQRRVRA